jgi:integrase
MATKRILTQLGIDRAKARSQRYDLPDGRGGVPGLMVRVSERGAKSFALRFRRDNEQPRMTLGKHPDMTLAEARTAARDALALVEQGIDPRKATIIDGVAVVVDPAEAAAEADRNSVAAVAGEYVERYLKRNTKRWRDAEQMLARDVLPALGTRPLASLARRDVLDLIDGVIDRGSPVSANRVLSLLKRFLNWAVARGIIEMNVAAVVKPPHKETPRQRTLTEVEIARVWPALQAMGWPFGPIGRLLLLLGQRRSEIADLRWADLDLEAGVLHLAGAATKTGVEHVLPLSGAAVEILHSLPRSGNGPLVFPASRIGSTRPVSGFSKALATAQKMSGVGGWCWHDLRRSTATHMARLKVPPHVVERILNHSGGGATMSMVARTYNTYGYMGEMRQALELWASEIDRIVAGRPAKVVPLRGVG